MPLKTPWVCILYWAPQRMGVVWLSLSYPVPWLQTQGRENKARVGPEAPFGNVHLGQRNVFLNPQDSSWFLFPSIGATFEVGFCEEQGCSILVSPPRSPPSHSDPHRRTAPSGALPLSDKPGTATVAGVHPQHAVNPLDGRADSCKYLRNEQMPQVHIKCKGCLSAPHDSVFTR